MFDFVDCLIQYVIVFVIVDFYRIQEFYVEVGVFVFVWKIYKCDIVIYVFCLSVNVNMVY